MVQVTASDYRIAQRGNAKVRQEFVRAAYIGQKEKDNLFFGASYKPEGFSYMEVSTFFGRDNTSVLGTTLFVRKKAFLDLSYGGFMSTLNDHEHVHVLQVRKHWKNYAEILETRNAVGNSSTPIKGRYFAWQALLELPAYANQVILSDKLSIKDKTTLQERYQEELRNFLYPRELEERKKLLEQILLGTPGDELIRRDILSK